MHWYGLLTNSWSDNVCIVYNAETSANLGVMLRQKKKKESLGRPVSHTEEAVITHKRNSPGLLTPFEEVAISFQTKSSNVKKSFPVTHQQLLTEDDLSSPEASDDESEEEAEQDVGFESMGMEKFEQFGNPIVPSSSGNPNAKSVEEEQVSQLKLPVIEQLDINETTPQQESEMDEEDQKEGSSEANDENAAAVAIQRAQVQLPPDADHEEDHQQPSPQMQQPSSRRSSDEECVDSVAELRDITDSASVQKRLNLFQRKDQKAELGRSKVATKQPSDLNVLKRGGVSARLKMFEDLEDGLEPQRPMSPPSPKALFTPTRLPAMIVEEEEDEDDEEMEDNIAPLPHIHIDKTRHGEKHKMDGISPDIVRKKYSPSKSPKVSFKPTPVLSKVAHFNKPTEALSRKTEKKKPTFSPLLMSTNAKSSSTTASSSHTNAHLEKEGAKKEESRATGVPKGGCPLLQKPKLSGTSVPHIFKNLKLSSGAVTIWQVKVCYFKINTRK